MDDARWAGRPTVWLQILQPLSPRRAHGRGKSPGSLAVSRSK